MKETLPTETPCLSEDALLAWLRGVDPELERWIGDDTVLLPNDGARVVTIDTQIEGVHYPAGLDPQTVARRLIAVNLSDLAAAAASPAYCVLSLARPPGFDHKSFFRAFLQDCRRYHLQLAGGDLASSSQAMAGLTLLGRIPEGGRWVNRRDARVGDGLWLGGQIGASALGRFLLADELVSWQSGDSKVASHFPADRSLCESACRAVHSHLSPTPQLELGLWLGQQERTAAIDVSDGLGKDLSRLCRASGVGAEIDVACLPLPSEFERLASMVKPSQSTIALAGGEDYVLLFSLPTEVVPPDEFHCHHIGTLTQGPEITWTGIERLAAGGSSKEIPEPSENLGWDHLQGQ